MSYELLVLAPPRSIQHVEAASESCDQEDVRYIEQLLSYLFFDDSNLLAADVLYTCKSNLLSSSPYFLVQTFSSALCTNPNVLSHCHVSH